MQNLIARRRRCLLFGLVLSALALSCAVAGVSLGAMRLSFGEVTRILLAKLRGGEALSAFAQNEVAVVLAIRLPRVLCGLLVGMGLAVAGAIFQSLLGNPLADPYTLGISTGAAFGAAGAIYLNVTFAQSIPVTPAAFAMAAVTLLAVVFLAERGGGMKAGNLVVAGMIVSAILSSAISFLKMLAGESVSAIVFWLMGSLSAKTWNDVWLLLFIVPPCALAACCLGADLNLMTLGERAAQGLGVDVKRARAAFMLLGALITAACVSVGGVIGFVGLIVPHMLRMGFASDNRVLLPLCAAGGALLLALADMAARLVGNGDVPVGVLTTLIGGPFFIYLFLRRRRT